MTDRYSDNADSQIVSNKDSEFTLHTGSSVISNTRSIQINFSNTLGDSNHSTSDAKGGIPLNHAILLDAQSLVYTLTDEIASSSANVTRGKKDDVDFIIYDSRNVEDVPKRYVSGVILGLGNQRVQRPKILFLKLRKEKIEYI